MNSRYRLPPPVQYPGGNSHLANFLQKYLPPHTTYVEPFVGGGSMFWRKDVAETNVLGDIDERTVSLYLGLRTGATQKCLSKGGFRQSREHFDALRQKRSPSACETFLLHAMSWRGNRSTFMPMNEGRTIGTKVIRAADRYRRKAAVAHIKHGNFAATMQEFDAPTTLHYLDPPWPEANKDKRYYGEHTLDPREVEHTARAMRGKVLIVYSPHESVLSAFDNKHWNIYKRKLTSASGVYAGSEPKYKLIISNWKLQ